MHLVNRLFGRIALQFVLIDRSIYVNLHRLIYFIMILEIV